MNDAKFISIVPRIKVWETKLLNKSFYDKLIDLNSLEEVVNLLQETPYGVYLEEQRKNYKSCRASGYYFELALNNSYISLCNDLYKSIKDNEIIKFNQFKNDYHNLKTLIKSKVLGKDFSYILNKNGAVAIEYLQTAIKNKDYNNISKNMIEAIKQSENLIENNEDTQLIDITLDRYMFKEMVQSSKRINSEYLKKYLTILIDLTNLKSTLRSKKNGESKELLKKSFIEDGNLSLNVCQNILKNDFENIQSLFATSDYEQVIREGLNDYKNTGSFSSLEKRVDNYIMNYIKNAKFINFGVEPIFAYLYAKETEIKNLRIILAGKLNNVSTEIIKERLRDSYV